MPADTPAAVIIAMENLVRAEVNEIRQTVINRRRSDSFPNTHSFDEAFLESEGVGAWSGKTIAL